MRRPGLRRLLRAARRRLSDRRELLIYCCTAERIRQLPHPSGCHRDAWGDLRYLDAWSYEESTRDQYLDIVSARRGEGIHHFYSLVENGTLVHYGWVTFPQRRAPDAALGLEFVPPEKSAALWDYFTHPKARGRGLYLETLWQCLHDAVEIDGARQAFIYVYADNAVSRHVIEKAGFEYRGSLVLERRFGRIRRFATYTDEPLDVRMLGSGRQAESRKHARAVRRLEHEEEAEAIEDERDRGTRGDHLGPRSSRQHAI